MDAGVPPHLFAYYTFDQAAGTTVATDTVGGRNGTLTGGAAFAAGMIGNEVNLNGTTAFVALPAGMLSTLRDVTITSWVRVRTDRAWQRVYDFGASTTVNMFLTPHNSVTNSLRFTITTGGINGEQHLDAAANAVLPAGTWEHVAVVLGASGGALYLNGALVTTNAAMTLRPIDLGATANNWVGRSQYAADPFLDGEVDDLRIYDQALTATEVANVFAGR